VINPVIGCPPRFTNTEYASNTPTKEKRAIIGRFPAFFILEIILFSCNHLFRILIHHMRILLIVIYIFLVFWYVISILVKTLSISHQARRGGSREFG